LLFNPVLLDRCRDRDWHVYVVGRIFREVARHVRISSQEVCQRGMAIDESVILYCCGIAAACLMLFSQILLLHLK
jgi:hypothetical protein